MSTAVEPAGPWTASLTMARRALLRIRRAPDQMADAILVPLLFMVLFTYLFGGAIAGSTVDYLRFLVPGALVMAVLLITVYSGTTINSDKVLGRLDRLRTLPIWQPAIVVGNLVGDLGRYLIASTLTVGLGIAMGYRPGGGVVGVVGGFALILGFAFALSWVWTALGLLLRSPQSLQVVGFLVQFSLTFASNVFVDPATMPGWLRAFVDANPVSHLVTAERSVLAGRTDVGEVLAVLVAGVLIVAVFGPVTMRLLRRLT